MPNICVAMDARLLGGYTVLCTSDKLSDKSGVTLNAIVLQVLKVHCRNVHRFSECLEREFP